MCTTNKTISMSPSMPKISLDDAVNQVILLSSFFVIRLPLILPIGMALGKMCIMNSANA